MSQIKYPTDSLFIHFPHEEKVYYKDELKKFFMFAGFVRPGKHRIYVRDITTSKQDRAKWYMKELIVPAREKDLPVYKHIEEKKQEVKIKTLESIFKDWRKDTP